MKALWMKIQSLFYLVFGKNYRCDCGHFAKQKTQMTIDGQSSIYTLGKTHDYCPQCWAKAAIRCAWCGETILPGDPITLYTPCDQNFKPPEYAVIYKKTPRLQLVGCFRRECAETGLDRTGFWMMPGRVQRAASPMEILLHANPTDGPMIFNDLGDPNKAILIPDEVAQPEK